MPVLSAAEGPPEAGRGSPARCFPDTNYLGRLHRNSGAIVALRSATVVIAVRAKDRPRQFVGFGQRQKYHFEASDDIMVV
jgi:hypothetical protein